MIEISNEFMVLTINGKVISAARERVGGWWEVTYLPRYFRRDQAITALTITELLETGYANDDPLVIMLPEQL